MEINHNKVDYRLCDKLEQSEPQAEHKKSMYRQENPNNSRWYKKMPASLINEITLTVSISQIDRKKKLWLYIILVGLGRHDMNCG